MSIEDAADKPTECGFCEGGWIRTRRIVARRIRDTFITCPYCQGTGLAHEVKS